MSMEKENGRKRNRAGEEKEGRRELRENGRGKGLGEGREEREMKKEQAIRMGDRVKTGKEGLENKKRREWRKERG